MLVSFILQSPCMSKSLLLFTSKTCAKCKIIKSELDKLMANHKEIDYKVISVDSKDGFHLALDKEVFSLPTLIIYKDGKEIKRFVTNVDIEETENLIS